MYTGEDNKIGKINKIGKTRDRSHKMDVDIALLGKSVVLPNTALPVDTRIIIEGIGRGNYVGFVKNTFRANHHRITFDLIGATVRFTRVVGIWGVLTHPC